MSASRLQVAKAVSFRLFARGGGRINGRVAFVQWAAEAFRMHVARVGVHRAALARRLRRRRRAFAGWADRSSRNAWLLRQGLKAARGVVVGVRRRAVGRWRVAAARSAALRRTGAQLRATLLRRKLAESFSFWAIGFQVCFFCFITHQARVE